NSRETSAESRGWVTGKDAVEEEVEAHRDEHRGCNEWSDVLHTRLRATLRQKGPEWHRQLALTLDHFSERGGQLFAGLVALRGVLREATLDGGHKLRRRGGSVERRRRLVDLLADERSRGAGERQAARDRVVPDHAERVEIAAS